MNVWRKCSSCKKDIPLRGIYYICSVSTCRQKKTDYAFCSVECWDGHIPVERHRGDDFSAIEKRAPDRPNESPVRRVISSSPSPMISKTSSSMDAEILVVASKVKKYVSERSGMNTSASTMEALSDRIRQICEQGIQNARADGRKTLMDRDIPSI